MNNESPSVLSDQAARERALDPLHSFIVQAPAGSGKTELLTQRYLRLLTTVEQPEQILAITFTRKAASEMRNRILQSLLRCRSTPRPDKPHEVRNWDLAQAALQADQQRGWQLELHPARLRIQTIDALNAGLARGLPMLAQLGASMEIAQDQRPIYEAVCVRLLEQLGDGSDDATHLEAVLRHLANRVPDFVSMLCDLLAHRDHWLPILISRRNDADLRASIEATLQAAIEHHLQRLHATLPHELHAELIELAAYGAAKRLKQGVKDDVLPMLQACSELTSMPEINAAALLAWRGIATMICKKDGEFYNSLTKTQGFPTDNKEAKQRMLALLNTLREIADLAALVADVHSLPSATFTDSQWQIVQALLQLLPRAVAELKLEFQARGQVDYVELSLRAQQALGSVEQPTDLALALDARLQHVLVDEFQDTSSTQMKLLHLLTAGWSDGDGRTLFCVGDPMQSIYRFRQAEVGLFLQVQQHGLPELPIEALHLQTNFRSTQPIVQWVNNCFAQLMSAEDDAESGAVHYRASQARDGAAMVGGVQVHAGIERTSQQEAIEICALVKRALAVDAQRIAVLVSGRSHVSAIAAVFKQAGIDFNAVDIERLQDRSVVQDLIALTRALVHLGDRTAWLACLRAPWCGLTLPDLHALVAHDQQQTIYTLLNEVISSRLGFDQREWFIQSPTSEARLTGFTTIMNAAIAERSRHSLRDWVERTWIALNGPACLRSVNELDDADAFFARLDELESAGDLADITLLEAQLSSLFAVSGSSANARVDIMTIHKSKGLEFDVVILPSLQRTGRGDSTRLLRWTTMVGIADGLVLAPPGAKGDEGDAIYQWLTHLEKQRSRHELQRLLYVATTRAKRELHLFGSVEVNQEHDAPKAPRVGSLLELLWPQLESQFVAVVSEHASATENAAQDTSLRLRRLPLTWTAPAADQTLYGESDNLVINADEPPEFDWVGETSRHVGTVVHAELERLVKLPSAMQSWSAEQRQSQLQLQLAELGVPKALRIAAAQRVTRAIESTLSDAKGRWILGLDVTHHDATAELALTGMINGKVVNGIIDRSFVDDSGVRWIVDFKTSAHEGGGRAAFLQSEVERYRGQMDRYARLMRAWKPEQPIKAALYFPLLGEWREM